MLSRAGKHSWFRVGVGVGHLDGAQPRWEAPLYHGHAATWVLTLTLTLALTLPLALALTLALALALARMRQAHRGYGYAEARAAFERVARQHGWRP